jgi:hypothetical protein
VTDRVKVFGPDGNSLSFDSAPEAYAHAAREVDALDGGRVETHDAERGTVTVERIVQTNDPARLNVDFIVESVRAEDEATEVAVDQAQAVTASMGVEGLLASPEAKKIFKPHYKLPTKGPAQVFLEAYLAMDDPS